MENGPCHRKRVLVSTEAAELLETAGRGSLGTCDQIAARVFITLDNYETTTRYILIILLLISDVRLRKFASEKKELQDKIRHLRLELEETRNRMRSERSSGSVLSYIDAF